MFSTDKNIETIADLVEAMKEYIGLQKKYLKLDVIDKIVRLLTALTIITVLAILLFLGCIYLSFAAAYTLSPVVGTAAAFAIIAGVHFVILALCILFRKSWIERPLVRFLAGLLMQE